MKNPFAIFLTLFLVFTGQAFAQGIQDRIKFSHPDGAGPFPTVILMHWTNGPGNAERQWVKRLNDNGITAVTLKSYNKIRGSVPSFEKYVPARIEHLQQAYDWVSAQPWSNGRISVLGRSHGAWAVLDALRGNALGSRLYRAVASAPYCKGNRVADPTIRSRTPLLIVVGSRDKEYFSDTCKVFVEPARASNRNVEFMEFPGGHGVDIKSPAAATAILQFLR